MIESCVPMAADAGPGAEATEALEALQALDQLRAAHYEPP